MKHVLSFFLLAAIAASAQTNRGSISGTVTDQTQAIISGIPVIITNAGTGEVRKVVTNNTGSFVVANLEPVRYTVEVEAAGFKKTVIENAKVDTATNTTVNITLQTGSVDTKITVSADATTVNTESGTLSSTVTER